MKQFENITKLNKNHYIIDIMNMSGREDFDQEVFAFLEDYIESVCRVEGFKEYYIKFYVNGVMTE
jgi:hypothetical protein